MSGKSDASSSVQCTAEKWYINRAQWNVWVPINDTTASKLDDGYIFSPLHSSSSYAEVYKQTNPSLVQFRAVSLRSFDVRQVAGHIYDQTGELVWSAYVDGYKETMQFERQVYKGRPVITMWQGRWDGPVFGTGTHLVLDSQYNVRETGLL